jgi:hypothetical protein
MKKMLLFSLAVIGLSFLAVSVAFALPSNQGLDKAKTVSPAIDEISGEVVAPPPAQLPEHSVTTITFVTREKIGRAVRATVPKAAGVVMTSPSRLPATDF